MSEQVQEQVGNPFQGIKFGTRSPQPIAEEPVIQEEEQKEEAKEEGVKEEAAPVKEEIKAPVKEEESAQEKEQPKEEGITLDLGGTTDDTPSEQPNETLDAYKTRVADLEAQLAKANETPKLDPRIAKLNEIIQKGGDINQSVWEMQSKSYDEVDITKPDGALSVLRDKLKYIDGDDNDLTKFYIDKHYPILSGKKGEDDYDSDEDYQSAKREEEMVLRKEAKQSIEPLKKYQDEMRLPEAPNHNQQEQYQKAIEAYRAEAITKVDEISTFEISPEEGVKLNIPITGEAKKFARSITTDPENQGQFFVNRYVNEDGGTNYNRLYTEMYYLENRPLIEKALYAQGRSAGKKEAIQELQGENASIPQKPMGGKAQPKGAEGLKNFVFSKRTAR